MKLTLGWNIFCAFLSQVHFSSRYFLKFHFCTPKIGLHCVSRQSRLVLLGCAVTCRYPVVLHSWMFLLLVGQGVPLGARVTVYLSGIRVFTCDSALRTNAFRRVAKSIRFVQKQLCSLQSTGGRLKSKTTKFVLAQFDSVCLWCKLVEYKKQQHYCQLVRFVSPTCKLMWIRVQCETFFCVGILFVYPFWYRWHIYSAEKRMAGGECII